MIKSWYLFLAAILISPLASPASAVEPNIKIMHVTAKEASSAMGSGGVTVPKVYVVSSTGKLIFEGKDGASQGVGPVMVALKKKPLERQSAIFDLLAKQGREMGALKGPVLITLESGASVGGCNACENYYPGLLSAVRKQPTPVTWIRVHIEKNNFKQ